MRVWGVEKREKRKKGTGAGATEEQSRKDRRWSWGKNIFYSSTEDIFTDFREREKKRGQGEREREIYVREKHQSVAFHKLPDHRLNPQPRYVP